MASARLYPASCSGYLEVVELTVVLLDPKVARNMRWLGLVAGERRAATGDELFPSGQLALRGGLTRVGAPERTLGRSGAG